MVSSKFDSLSVRPPTPPKDIQDIPDITDVDETLQFLDDPFGDLPPAANPKIAATKRLLSTPDQSPSSDASIPSSVPSTTKKRVIFELCTSPNKKAVANSWTPTRSSPLRPLPQTRVFRPLKSILKPSDSTSTPPPTAEGAAAHQFKTFADMLESIVSQLAQEERTSRLDAYHGLQRTMQAYDNIPDEQALKNKMSLLTQFIRRDLQAQSQTGTGLDTQLITQALKLLLALLRLPNLIAAMEDDFCAFIVDRSIQVASDSSVSKTVVNTHLAVFMQQTFRPKTMTNLRVEKMLDALNTIQDRIKGYSVQAYRLRIYKKLISQRPDIMSKHADRWFSHAFRSLISFHKDISQSALETTISAARAIGQDRHITKACLALLNRVKSDGKTTIAQVLAQELEKMLDAENASMVPQIWSAVTALLKDHMSRDMFTSLADWLRVFEKCLKSDIEQVKVGVNVAFGFLIYAVNIPKETAKQWTKMLLNIPLGQVQSRGPMKKYERDAIYSGYHTLLYYALRPTAPFDQLDRCWNEFVAGFWNPLIHHSPTQAGNACHVVSALLDGSRNPWNEQRALDFRHQVMVQRAELPLLDPRWVRRSLPSILRFVETLLDATPWSENEQQEDQPAKIMWLALLNSLVEASSKEVMASSETKEAMAHIVNLLRRVWDRHTAEIALSQTMEDSWADKFCFLVETVVQKLGPTQFADRSLTRNGQDEFEVASTPSHRARQQVTCISPLLYFVDLLVNRSEGRLPDAVRLRAIRLIVEPCFNIQNTRMGRLEMIRDCSAIVDESLTAVVAQSFWAQIATLLKTSLQAQVPDSNERVSRQLGKEYGVVADLLCLGSASLLYKPRGLEILDAFIDTVGREAGDGALVIAVIEGVSERIFNNTTESDKTSYLPYISALLRNLPSKSISRRILDQGRQFLWPSSPAAGRNTDFDPYNHLYSAIVSAGSAAYQELRAEDVDAVKQFLGALRASIKNCSISLLAVYLRKTQDVLHVWVEDPERKLQNTEQWSRALHREVVGLWRDVNEAVERLPRKDSQVLLHLETLVLAGFSSRRRTIVNISIDSWNKTFGKEDTLRYPSRLEEVLRRFANTVELRLPSLNLQDDDTADDLSFYDSDNSMDDVRRTFKSPRVKESPFKVGKSARNPKNQSPVASPASRRKSARQTPKIRLRHDNSQIQFEPVTSSPTNPFNQESQVLTERQKEMIERQRLAGGLFANLGAPSPQRDIARSPMEIHSDAPSVDELPSRRSRTTPLKTLAAMGPMDAFLGSSPTPHARRRSQRIVSDGADLATPSAVRTVQIITDDSFGSSPPRLERVKDSGVKQPAKNDAANVVEYEQAGSSFAQSFEDTTINEDTTLNEDPFIAPTGRDDSDEMGESISGDTVMSDVAGNAVDSQLTAQIDADMQAADANHSFDTQEPESVNETPKPTRGRRRSKAEPSSASHVGNSFESPTPVKGTPRSRELRRSSRHSIGSPIQPPSEKKRKQTPVKDNGKAKKAEIEGDQSKEKPTKPHAQSHEVKSLDNTAAQQPNEKSRKRKTRSSPQPAYDSQTTTPDTGRTRGPLRSQSRLKQVENAEDVAVEETPAPKRARPDGAKDVSEAKTVAPTEAHSSQSQRRVSQARVMAKSSKQPETAVIDSDAVTDYDNSDTQSAITEVAATVTSQQLRVGATPGRSFTERVILTPRSIINKLKEFKDYFLNAPGLVIGRAEEREIDDALFDIRRQVFAAGLRAETEE